VPGVVLGSLFYAASSDTADKGPGTGPDHVCGFDVKALDARFETACAKVRGARLETTDFRPGVDVAAKVVRGELNLGLAPGAEVSAIARRHGLSVVRELPGLATLATAQERDLRLHELCLELAREPGVLFAEPNFVARTALTPNDPFFTLEKGALHAGIERAWDVTTGDPSIIVAVLDTGVDLAHKELKDQLVSGWDFVNNTNTPSDDNGHGTSVAGIIAAKGNDGEGTVGVAWGARVMPVKVADGDGNASVANVAAGLDWAVAHGARIVNLSLGTRVNSQALAAAIQRAIAANVLVVAAAGNDPVHVACYPAAYPGVLSVGSVSDTGELAYSTVVAPSVQVGAPGEDVVTTLPGDVYGFVSGSSAASAFASGVAALCLSKTPGLSAAQVAQCLRGGQQPIAALAGFEGSFSMGALDAGNALDRAATGFVDIAVTEVRLYPAKPRPSQPVKVVVQLRNLGNSVVSNAQVAVSWTAPGQASIDGGTATVPTLGLGDRSEVTLSLTAPAAGSYTLVARTPALAGETALANNERDLSVTVDPSTVADLRVVDRTVSDVDLTTGAVTLGMTVENRGTDPAPSVSLEAWVQGTRVDATSLSNLAVGERRTWQTTWKVPVPAPQDVIPFEARALPLPGETQVGDNTAYLDFFVGTAAPLKGLFQQSNGVDLCLDAAWRIQPGRDYVPVLLFLASKGNWIPTSNWKAQHTTMTVRDDPASTAGTLVYEDLFGQAPTQAPSGLVVTDEMGVPRTGAHSLEPFAGAPIQDNGHHDIFRIPRAAFGVPSIPPDVMFKFLDVKVEWSYEIKLFYFFTITRTGSHRAVLRFKFSPTPLPELPGENHRYDVHTHSIAEWCFGSPLDIFCPRKAYGGPIQMIKEAAFAMGMTDAVDDVNGKVCVTDHNNFYNSTIPDPNGPEHRPPYGPASITAQPGTDQHTAYGNIFGLTSGEEVTFAQTIPLGTFFGNSIPASLATILPGLPLGAHMLSMRCEHIEGPWHGGGWMVSPNNPNITVNLYPLLGQFAKQNQTTNARSFCYAAHPYSSQGWTDDNFNHTLGLDPTLRTRDMVHDQTNKFVLKGLEFWNGRGTRHLDSSKIDFNDLNPWADPQFAAGSSDWDMGGVQFGMNQWHTIISKTLDYQFTTDPDTKFIRKVYIAAGSDAHGDFNFTVSRMATPITLSSTFYVSDDPYYDAYTYVFADGKPGATSIERFMSGYEDGNTVITDGPLVEFSMDADSHWDSQKLSYHAQTASFENADGQIGGGGPLDGERTMLVQRNSPNLYFKYRYTNTKEWGSQNGQIVAIKIYKDETGSPNPTRTRAWVNQIVGRGSLATTGPDQDLTQALDPTKEGPIDALGCYSLGAFTGVDPDQGDLAPDEGRCYTNPVYAIPYDVQATVAMVDSATHAIPAGQLSVTFRFDASMSDKPIAAEVKALDRNGASTDGSKPPLAALAPSGGRNGWSDRPGNKSSVLTLVNAAPVLVNGDEFPAGSGQVTLVLYTRDPLKDAAGNALHTIATTVTAVRVPGSAPALPASASVPGTSSRGGTTAPGSTASGSTASGSSPSSFGGSNGGGGGCAFAGSASSSGATLWPLLGLGLGLVLRRGRVRRRVK
jgi:subtilisin family serine protease